MDRPMGRDSIDRDAMLHFDLSRPPRPDPGWLHSFTGCLLELRPDFSEAAAMQLARLAHRSTWLLDPAEAAELWESAVRHHMPVPRR
jgi:hypothetical protein